MGFDWKKKTYVMGIVNLTSDSFSGDGLLDKSIEDIVQQVKNFVNYGVDIIDVGGESTRPGSEPVSLEDELERVIPAIETISDRINIPISIDTYKAEVAKKALIAGASWVNDVWGLKMDDKLVGVVADADCRVILMHNRSKPKMVSQQEKLGGRYIGVEYQNLIGDIKSELMESVEIARNGGIRDENIILDPGIGFGKTVAQNLQIINKLKEIKTLGFPILLGSSRKSFIGYTLDLPADQRLEGTATSIAIGIKNGANIIRVHDVEYMIRVSKMSDAILHS